MSLKKPLMLYLLAKPQEMMPFHLSSSKEVKLHELMCLRWREGQVPQSVHDAKIVTLYKNKGDRSDCNNCRGISLLSIVGKVFASVYLPDSRC